MRNSKTVKDQKATASATGRGSQKTLITICPFCGREPSRTNSNTGYRYDASRGVVTVYHFTCAEEITSARADHITR